MLLRYPGEVELERRGIDEGAGRGFDNIDLSAAATRVIAAADSAPEIVDWFVRELTGLGWTQSGGGWVVGIRTSPSSSESIVIAASQRWPG